MDRPYVDRVRSISHVFLALRLMFTDAQRRKDLFTNWIHVPIGIASLLFLTWLIKQAMDRAPFRFPSPVLAMVFLFILLLTLDFLSTTPPVQKWAARRSCATDDSHTSVNDQPQRKILLQPMLALLEAPCDFCLRYMSVMFTPSFILIPAREIINGKEIGLITGWFAASQLLGLIFPVLLHKAIRSVVAITKRRVQHRKNDKEDKLRRAHEQRRASVATLVAVMSNINPTPAAPGLVAKADTESTLGATSHNSNKHSALQGGEKLSSIATGLSGMTAIATAPLTLNTAVAINTPGARAPVRNASQRQDAQRQLEHVQLETARQQGDPYATAHTPIAHHHHYPQVPSAPNSPRPGSALHHNHRLHHHNSGYFAHAHMQDHGDVDADERPALGRSRSLARSWIGASVAGARMREATSLSPSRVARPRSGNDRSATKGRFGAAIVGPGSGLKKLAASSRRPQSASAASQKSAGQFERVVRANDTLSPTFDEYILRARQDLLDRRSSGAAMDDHVAASKHVKADSVSIDPRTTRRSVEATGDEIETLVMPTLVAPTPLRTSHDEKHDTTASYSLSKPNPQYDIRRPSKAESDKTVSDDIEAHVTSDGGMICEKKVDCMSVEQIVTTTSGDDRAGPPDSEPEMDAVDRLVEKLWTLIPWFVFSLVLVAGVPLFYIVDISLPLFLGINLVTFLGSITLVPAKIRRYAHPILTTSITTVLILWGVGEIRGWSLRRTLNSYSVDAKYTVLWSLQGYTGPVIGAGDVLFSTLDAGIVSLAIPMYRYRWDLWLHLVDMLVVLLPCSMMSLFVWPTIAANIGIAPERALAFASRFMSTPLAIELSLTIGADESITVVLVVITGIVISIFKDAFFRLFGLNPDLDGPGSSDESDDSQTKQSQHDYLTIGIAMGSTAGAIGASSLIAKPRCMAIASLSFVLFGAILLICAAIPPIVETLRMLANAPLDFTPAV